MIACSRRELNVVAASMCIGTSQAACTLRLMYSSGCSILWLAHVFIACQWCLGLQFAGGPGMPCMLLRKTSRTQCSRHTQFTAQCMKMRGGSISHCSGFSAQHVPISAALHLMLWIPAYQC